MTIDKDAVERVARALMQAMAERPIGDEEWRSALKNNPPSEIDTLFRWSRAVIAAVQPSPEDNP